MTSSLYPHCATFLHVQMLHALHLAPPSPACMIIAHPNHRPLYVHRYRTLRSFKDPLFLSARIVDKFIAGESCSQS